jgi:hypothetical protein
MALALPGIETKFSIVQPKAWSLTDIATLT